MVDESKLYDSGEDVGEGDEDKVVEGGGVGHLRQVLPRLQAQECHRQHSRNACAQSTYIHRVQVVSGVFRTIDPHPLSIQRACPPPASKERGTHSPGGEGERGQYFEDARHWIGLLQCNPSTYLRKICLLFTNILSSLSLQYLLSCWWRKIAKRFFCPPSESVAVW